MTHDPFNVLFLCTGNSARSILAESILRKDGAGQFIAYSAGSHPKDDVNPLAIEILSERSYPTEGLRSKSWDKFALPGAPEMHFVFTVCDDAANETCPVWPGQPMTAHWGVEDPAKVDGPDFEKRAAFARTFDQMKRRIGVFTSLPIKSLDRLALSRRIKDIGKLEGATEKAMG